VLPIEKTHAPPKLVFCADGALVECAAHRLISDDDLLAGTILEANLNIFRDDKVE